MHATILKNLAAFSSDARVSSIVSCSSTLAKALKSIPCSLVLVIVDFVHNMITLYVRLDSSRAMCAPVEMGLTTTTTSSLGSTRDMIKYEGVVNYQKKLCNKTLLFAI
jgi:hypothetical protein